MKTKSLGVIGAGAVAAALGLLGASSPQTCKAQAESTIASVPDGATAPVAPDDSPGLPPNVYPSSPLAQVIRLTQAGVSEDVIMAYVTNSGSTFNLDPDKIIYLKDIGAPDDLVTAMMQRDQVLQAQMTASANQPPPQPAPPPEAVATEPVPAETPVEPPAPAPVTVNYFYNTLAPYGNWVSVAGYGECWQPTTVVVNAGWQPYCDNGHWVYTDCGWYWISDYSWGWAPFHYGRWFHHTRYGWCWYPDTVWGPSWVTWRYSSDYCGWAPLPPFTAFAAGFGFTYRGAAVSAGFNFGLGVSAYTFVPTGNFCDPHPWRYRVGPREMAPIYNQTTVINNYNVDGRNRNFINRGIDPQHITEVTHTPIRPVAIRDATAPIARGEQLGRDGRTLTVNRPNFGANPQPSGQGRVMPHAAPASPAMGSSYQPSPNGNKNYNTYDAPPPPRYQPATPTPTPTPGQRPMPPAANGSPFRHETPAPAEQFRSPANQYASVTPVQPSALNYDSTDNRRYPSPHMLQAEQQSPQANPGNSGGRGDASAPPPPGAPRPNHSQPNAAGGQAHGAPPAQPQRPGGNRNQNGQ